MNHLEKEEKSGNMTIKNTLKVICIVLICVLVTKEIVPIYAKSSSSITLDDTICVDGVEYQIELSTDGKNKY